MNDSETQQGLKLCLISGASDVGILEMVRADCPAPHVVTQVMIKEVRDERFRKREALLQLADAALVVWKPRRADTLGGVFENLRRSGIPVIAVCSDDPDDHIEALRTGADDVMIRPLHVALIHARLMSVRRLVGQRELASRHTASAGETENRVAARPVASQLVVEPIVMDMKAHRVRVKDTLVKFTTKEFELLKYLMERVGELCTRDDILEKVWGIDFDTGTNMVDVYMYFLRKKLKNFGLTGIIQTVRGHGYRLMPAAVAQAA